MPLYGQVVVGPPGSGKTTYCDGMQQYLKLLGRDALVVNLDPANESTASPAPRPDVGADAPREELGEENTEPHGTPRDENDAKDGRSLPYETILDVTLEIVNLTSVMTDLSLGPNGGLVYCMEYIERHFDHVLSLIRDRVSERENPGNVYLLFDCPGQVELYTHCTCVQNVLRRLVKELDVRLCAVQLIDAHSCADPAKFVSAALLSTTTMLRLELPAVNVLSKVDLIGTYGQLPYNLEYFAECQDLGRLVDYLDGGIDDEGENDDAPWLDDPEYQAARAKTKGAPFRRRHRKLHEQLCEVVDDFSLLSYVLLDISDAESVGRVVAKVDRSNGYVFTKLKGTGRDEDVTDMFRCAVQVDGEWGYESIADVQERFLGTFKDNIPELEQDRRKG